MIDFVGGRISWLFEHWLLVLPLVLGFLAVWLLLPQARRRPVLPAFFLGVAAMLVAGYVFLVPSGELSFDVLFSFFSGSAVVAGILLITQRSPVHAALWFAIVILATCGLFLLQSAPFLAAATIIIYAGAIVVTFLFVIMLAQQTGMADYDRRSREPLLASLAGFVLLGTLLYTLQACYRPVPTASQSLLQERLRRIERLIQDHAPLEEVDAAMRLENVPLGMALLDEVQLGAAPRSDGTAKIEEALSRFGLARQKQDPQGMLDAITRMREVLAAARQAHDLGAGFLPATSREGGGLSSSSPIDSGHVAGLGRSIFSDYLWAVELAGTILLAATIGAIAIAARGKELPR